MTTIGEITFFLILGMLLAAIALAIIVTASITRGKSYLPQIRYGPGPPRRAVKAFCKLLSDDRIRHVLLITPKHHEHKGILGPP